MTRTVMIKALESVRDYIKYMSNWNPEGFSAVVNDIVEALKAEEAPSFYVQQPIKGQPWTMHVERHDGKSDVVARSTITTAEIASASLPERNSNAANSIANNTIRATQHVQAALTLEDRVTALEKQVEHLSWKPTAVSVGEVVKKTMRTEMEALKKSGGAQ